MSWLVIPKCDKCGHSDEEFTSMEIAWQQMKKQGWTNSGMDVNGPTNMHCDRCPS